MAKYVRGDRETQQALRLLRDNILVPMGEAGQEALKPTLAEAKSNVPRRSGQLRKSLRILRRRKGMMVKFRVGPYSTNTALWYHLARVATVLEFGRKGGKRGTIAPMGWLRRSFEATKDQIAKIYGERLGPAVEKRAAKVASRLKR